MKNLKERLLNGETIINGWLSNATLLTSEIISRAGYDSITIDMQHGFVDYERTVSSLAGIQDGITPIIRVAWNDESFIQKSLDAGALGIICPMINNGEEAEKFANSVYYPPMGERSSGPVRAKVIYEDYFARANTEILALAMVETPDAVKNLEDILSVEGINGVYVGPSDLSLSHGFGPGIDRNEPEVLKIMDHIINRAKAHGKFAGLHTGSPVYAKTAIKRGFQFVTVSSDIICLQHGLDYVFEELNRTKK